MKWSEEAWNAAAEIYDRILELPFVRELAAGTLSRERFQFYIGQDSMYIDNYSRVLAHVGSRMPRKEWMEDFLRFASDGIAVEKALHEFYLTGHDTGSLRPSPTCLLYNSYEAAKAMAPVEVEAASILPCFWVYQRVGESIMRECAEGNPYARWIETYGDEGFAESNRRAIEICDGLAEGASPEARAQMTEAFVMSTRMEWMFWDSAYRMEQWPV